MQEYFDISSVKYDIQKLEELKSKRKQGLYRGSQASKGKGKGNMFTDSPNVLIELQKGYKEHLNGKKTKEDRKYKKIDNYNIDSMLNSYSYISQLKKVHYNCFNLWYKQQTRYL